MLLSNRMHSNDGKKLFDAKELCKEELSWREEGRGWKRKEKKNFIPLGVLLSSNPIHSFVRCDFGVLYRGNFLPANKNKYFHSFHVLVVVPLNDSRLEIRDRLYKITSNENVCTFYIIRHSRY